MKQLTFSIPIREIPFSRETCFQIMGFDNDCSSHFETIFNDVFSSLEFGTATGQVLIFEGEEVKISPSKLTIQDVEFHTGAKIGKYFRNCEGVVLLICTVGMEFEKKMKSFSEPVEVYFADTIGSLKCDELANLIHDRIASNVQENGLLTTNRYSPGYCQWSVSEQQKLFSFFQNNQTDIKLNDSSLMIPIKSISALLGLGKDVKQIPSVCQECDDLNCMYRKRKFTT